MVGQGRGLINWPNRPTTIATYAREIGDCEAKLALPFPEGDESYFDELLLVSLPIKLDQTYSIQYAILNAPQAQPLPLQRPSPALVSEDVHKIVEAQRSVARRRLTPLRQPAALPQEDVGLD